MGGATNRTSFPQLRVKGGWKAKRATQVALVISLYSSGCSGSRQSIGIAIIEIALPILHRAELFVQADSFQVILR